MKLTVKTQEQLLKEGWKTDSYGPFAFYYTGDACDPQNLINIYDFTKLAGKTCECTEIRLNTREPYVKIVYERKTRHLPWCAMEEYDPAINPKILFEKYTENNIEINYYKKFKVFDLIWGLNVQTTPEEAFNLISWCADKLGYTLIKKEMDK